MSKDRYIWLGGKRIYVSEEVYRAYYRPEWREAKQDEVRDDNEYSLDMLKESGIDIASGDMLVDDIVVEKVLLEELYAALNELSEDERDLIDWIYFKGETAREYSRKTYTNHTNVNRRHKNILEKLQNLLKKD